jgi:hypothetical protein
MCGKGGWDPSAQSEERKSAQVRQCMDREHCLHRLHLGIPLTGTASGGGGDDGTLEGSAQVAKVRTLLGALLAWEEKYWRIGSIGYTMCGNGG